MKTKVLSLLAALLFLGSNLGVADTTSPLPTGEIAKVLNELVERSIDAQKGYQDAAAKVNSLKLRGQFTAEALKRQQFAEVLQNQINALGEKFDTKGSVEGSLHRAWLDTKTAVTGEKQDDAAVLGAVKTGESTALKSYEDALTKGLPKEIDKLVLKQKKEIKDAFNKVDKELERIKSENKNN